MCQPGIEPGALRCEGLVITTRLFARLRHFLGKYVYCPKPHTYCEVNGPKLTEFRCTRVLIVVCLLMHEEFSITVSFAY